MQKKECNGSNGCFSTTMKHSFDGPTILVGKGLSSHVCFLKAWRKLCFQKRNSTPLGEMCRD